MSNRIGPSAALDRPPLPATDASTPAEALDRWTGDARFMQSLARGLLALSAVAKGDGEPVSARRIADATGLSVATARRCLYTLDAIHYVRANRNGAVSGPALARLAADYAGSEPLISACGPILDELHANLGVAVSFALFREGQPIIVASSSSDSILKLQLPIGAAMPVHCTSAGKIFLAHLSPEALAQTLSGARLVAHTPHTLTSVADLRAAVQQVSRQGFAISDQELVVGIRTAAVPVRNGHDKVIASINASMLAPAVPLRDVRARIIPALTRAATILSRLGL